MAAYTVNFCWGLIVLLALTGWGRLVAGRALRDAGWGLHAAWGMAALLAAGGPLLLLGWATREVLIVLVLTGAAIWLALNRGRWHVHKATLGCFCAAIVLVYAPQVVWPFQNIHDDPIAYQPFIKRILDTGSLLEPFSLRRLVTYGGQSLLQALAGCFGKAEHAGLADGAVAPLIFAGLVWEEVRRHGGTRASALGWAALAVTFPTLRGNLTSQMTGAVVFFAIYRSLGVEPISPARRMALLALLSAGAVAVRQNSLVSIAVIVPLAWLLENRLSVKKLPGWLTRTAVFGALVVLLMSPWMMLLYRSSGTPLFPLIRGNQHPEVLWSDPVNAVDLAHWIGGFVLYPATLGFLLPIAVVLAVVRKPHLVALAVGAIVSTLALLIVFNRSNYYHILRYANSVVLPLLVAALIEGAGRLRKSVLITSVAAAWGLVIWGLGSGALKGVVGPLQLIPALITPTPMMPPAVDAAHRVLDQAIPHGASVLTVVPAPYLLNFRTHRIFIGDELGQAAPPPGIPFRQGPEAFKRYLQSVGIEYIAYEDFNQQTAVPNYSREYWHRQDKSKWIFGKRMEPQYLDFMQNVDALRSTEEVAWQHKGYYLLRLK